MLRGIRPLALTAAERARTVLAGSANVRVKIPGLTLEVHRHALTPDGSVLFQAPPDMALEVADLIAIDVAAVPQPDRVRGQVVLVGRLEEVVGALPAGLRDHLTGTEDPRAGRLLRLVPEEVHLDWHCEDDLGPLEVPVAAYRTAFPDPLLGFEASWLPHLQAGHDDVLAAVARYELGVDGEMNRGGRVDVHALGLDRYGLVLRIRDGAARFDLRIAFDRPAACGCDAREALNSLVSRAGLTLED